MRSLAFVWLVALAACSDSLSSSELPPGETLFMPSAGSLNVPLRGHDREGSGYRLRQGTLELSGTALMTLAIANEAAPKSLTTPLPGGSYQAYLRAGFQLVEIREDGSEQLVDAILTSPNPATIAVESSADRALHLTFRVGERTIALGGHGALKMARGAGPDTLVASAPESTQL